MVAKSGFPSPSKSPIDAILGSEPTARSTFATNESVPLLLVLRNTERDEEPELATVKSSLPSPSRSPMETLKGVAPVAKSTLAASATVSTLLVLRKTETLVEKRLLMAISGLPSPSKSPMATPEGVSPVVKSTLPANDKLPGVLVLRITDTFEAKALGATKSSLPSPSMSPRPML